MRTRAIAGLLVLVLIGPSAAAAACELACVVASHHDRGSSPAEPPCHDHQGARQAASVQAGLSTLCHESGDLPFAVVDAWLSSVFVHAAPVAHVVVAPAITAVSLVRAAGRRASFDPRPPHRPLRV